MAYACISFHFLKREYETLFIHRFSHATMPLTNLFKNCAHYWLLSGALIGRFLYSSEYQAPSVFWVLLNLLLFVAAEMANFYTHFVLSKLRPKGSTRRAVPNGFGFDWVSCPNYTFEILAWIAFSMMTGLWSGKPSLVVLSGVAWFFTAVASAQMYFWAIKKHKRYRHEFPEYPHSRKILIPYLL